jgi:hypothetical protein
MRILTTSKYALGATAAAAMLAACTGGGSQLNPAGPTMGANVGYSVGQVQKNGVKSTMIAAKSNAHGEIKHFTQWMEKNAAKNRLLYVSDYSANIVQVYNYPSQGTQNPPAGTLTRFSNPQGLCVDKSNNVYVSNTGGQNVLVYPYGATSPSTTLGNPGEYPGDCSVNPDTGDVAVSDIFSPTTGQGAVTIFPAGSTSGTVYVEPGGILECYFVGYMPNGDLYVDGINSSGFGMAYLPSGSTTWQPVSFTGLVNFPGALQTDNTNLTVADQSGSGGTAIYQCSASGATVDCNLGSTVLGGTTDVVQPFIKRGIKGVTGVDSPSKTESTWAYPAGGAMRPNKTFTINNGTYSLLVGNAVLLPSGGN